MASAGDDPLRAAAISLGSHADPGARLIAWDITRLGRTGWASLSGQVRFETRIRRGSRLAGLDAPHPPKSTWHPALPPSRMHAPARRSPGRIDDAPRRVPRGSAAPGEGAVTRPPDLLAARYRGDWLNWLIAPDAIARAQRAARPSRRASEHLSMAHPREKDKPLIFTAALLASAGARG
jgi:hypothetical protein